MLVTVDDGVATRIQGDPQMPFTEGTLCTKVAHYLERTYAPDRLQHPLRFGDAVDGGGLQEFEQESALAAFKDIVHGPARRSGA